jgi:copper ion binding protein
MNQTIVVSGMTCGHCVNSVTEELSKINGVSKVEVDLATGQVDIETNEEIGRIKLEEAIKEAGYELN